MARPLPSTVTPPTTPHPTPPRPAALVAERPSRPALGILCMVLATLSVVVQDTLAKWLVTEGHPILQVVWARYFFACLILFVVAALVVGPGRAVRTGDPGTQLARGALVLVSTLCNWAALSIIPIADGIAVAFTTPLFMTALAVPLLGERVGWRRWTAVVVGLVGVLVILRPGLGAVHPAAALILITAFTVALYQILSRKIAPAENAWSMQFYTAVVGAVGMSLVLPWGWQPLGPSEWPLFIGLGAVGLISHLLIVSAVVFAPASLVAPFGYTQMIWGVVVGFAVFGDLPDAVTLVGSGVVAGSGAYVFAREARLARHAAAAGERGTS